MRITYDPSAISCSELPIARRARMKRNELWGIYTARAFCNLLRHDPDPDKFGLTPEEWENIAAVARGKMWPVPDTVYDSDDWTRDETFSAVPGQEVTREIYDHMLNCMPPLHLPHCRRTQGFTAGFMMGEPTSSDKAGRLLYSAFGRVGERCYFIGLLPVHPTE